MKWAMNGKKSLTHVIRQEPELMRILLSAIGLKIKQSRKEKSISVPIHVGRCLKAE